MNLTWYSHYFSPEIGAPSARIYELSQSWLDMGNDVQVVTCFPNHPIGKIYPNYIRCKYMSEVLNGIKVHRNWSYITPNKGFIKKLIGHMSFLPLSLLLSNPHIARPDVVIGSSPTFFAAMAAAATGIKRNIPFIVEVRDLWPAIFVELGVLKNPFIIRMLEYLELTLYKLAVRVVTVTDSFRQNLISRGVPPSKVVTIPNGADISHWQPIKPDAGLKRKLELEYKFVVLYIGAHGISHALGRILDSAERLKPFSDIHFLFVGEGAEKSQLIRQAQRKGLENVTFLDPVDKEGVKAFYSIADVCLVPLRNIGLFDSFIPSKMFEMMAMGRPVLASLSGESADIIKRSGGGIIVEPENSEALAQAVLHLFQHPEKGKTMGNNGRKFVRNNYSRCAFAIKYARVLEDAVRDFQAKKR